MFFFFFFQAEDGIRDGTVTGVQTCALPILLLADSDNGNWVFRRNPAIVRPLQRIGLRTADGVPYLAPTLQLLFKAKDPRPKDIADFNLMLPELRAADRAWLASALAATHPGHPWLARLRGESNP